MRKKLLSALLAVALTLPSGLSFEAAKEAQAASTFKTKSPYTGSTYTHSAVFEGKNIYHGVDVSYHNGTIDWAKVKADGIEYAFIRVAYRGWGSGKLVDDAQYKKNIKNALANGIKVGLYFFTEAVNTTEAKEEAEYAVKLASDYEVTLPIAFDYEYQYSDGKNVSRKKGLSKAKATANTKAFCEAIKAAGYTPAVYANGYDLKNLIDGASLEKDYLIWLANYTTKTSYTGLYDIWQYSSSGTVSGIKNRCDVNFYYSDKKLSEINDNGYDLKNATISSISAQTYTGKEITPSITLKIGNKKLVKDQDYKLAYTNNIKAGKATIKITAAGDYVGARTKTFDIKPKAIKAVTAVPATKRVTLKWNSSDGANGYQIYRRSTYKGTFKLVKTIKDPKTLNWTNKSLSEGREYTFKVRPYGTGGGKTVYNGFVNVTAGPLPAGKSFYTATKTVILKTPSAKGKKLVTAPAGAMVEYIGKTVLANKKKFYHVAYKKGSKTYKGYLTTIKGIKFYEAKKTLANAPLCTTAGNDTTKVLTIPKGKNVLIMSKATVNKVVWYKVSYYANKKVNIGFVSSEQIDGPIKKQSLTEEATIIEE